MFWGLDGQITLLSKCPGYLVPSDLWEPLLWAAALLLVTSHPTFAFLRSPCPTHRNQSIREAVLQPQEDRTVAPLSAGEGPIW